jgi:hypothetical protein
MKFQLAEKAEKPSSLRSISHQAKRVAIVSSVIAKIFNPSKCWMVTIQLLLDDTFLNLCLYCLFPVFIVWLLFVSVLLFNSVFYSLQCFCSIQFFCSVFKLFSICSVLIPEMYSRYFDPLNINHEAVNKHHTADRAIFCLSIGARGLVWS